MRAVADTESCPCPKVPDPIAGPGEVVIDVVAAGVNRADLLQRRGAYPPPKGASEILGLEVSGRISAVGPDAGGWRVGDEVCALLAGGGYAEKVAVPALAQGAAGPGEASTCRPPPRCRRWRAQSYPT